MRIYHFCSAHDARSIMKNGITRGMIPMWDKEYDRWKLRAGFQWLTYEGNPDGQSWATHYMIRANRTEVRLTIEIPENMTDELLTMQELQDMIPEMSEHLYTDWEGSDQWRVYRGYIPKKWITEYTDLRKPI